MLEVVPAGQRFPRSSARAYVPNPHSDLARELVGRINKFRSSHRLPDLAISAVLCGTAQDWSSRMASVRSLFHGDPVARKAAVGIVNVASGECIAEGRTVDEVMAMWTGDGPHRAILLGGYERAGVGATLADDGWWYWCLDVAAGKD